MSRRAGQPRHLGVGAVRAGDADARRRAAEPADPGAVDRATLTGSRSGHRARVVARS